MEEALLRKIAEEYLVPFFSGAHLEETSVNSTSREKLAAFRDPVSIAFKAERKDAYRLVLTRAQPYDQTTGDIAVPELKVIQSCMDMLGSIASVPSEELQRDLLSTFQRRVVARAISSKDEREPVLLAGIDRLMQWSRKQYEGAPISLAIGFRHKPQPKKAPNIDHFGLYDFSAVVSNGHDTLVEFDFDGRLIGHASLADRKEPSSYCPLRQSPIAEWTAGDDKKRRVAMCLNRSGEILIFRDRRLLFTMRQGRWSFLNHDPVVKQMGIPKHDLKLRRAIYETCLDASFARTGACIGVVSSAHSVDWMTIVDDDDRLDHGTSSKAKTLRRLIPSMKFQNLDRRLRQELAAIDGAVLISHRGNLLAVGAILKIRGGSTGGGRLAAAKALAQKGLGIKVSQDGAIDGYREGRSEPAFRVM